MKDNKETVQAIVLPCGKCASYHVCADCVWLDTDRRYGSQFFCKATDKYEYPDNSAATYCKYFVER